MVMWIVIGVLVGVVIIFLVVASVFDKKKAKKAKVANQKLEEQKAEAGEKVTLFLDEVVARNNKLLINFKPSVGNLKMGEIKSKARKALMEFKRTQEFKYAKASEKNTKLIKLYEDMHKDNSNVWMKHFAKELKALNNDASKISKDIKAKYAKQIDKYLEGVY